MHASVGRAPSPATGPQAGKCVLILVALAALNTASLQPQPSPSEYRLRVSVNLVQVDATVIDSHGKPVAWSNRR